MNKSQLMKLAHKIFRSKITNQFSFALKYAWVVCKKAQVQVQDTFVQIKSKLLTKEIVYGIESLNRKRNEFKVMLDKYSMNLFIQQVKAI